MNPHLVSFPFVVTFITTSKLLDASLLHLVHVFIVLKMNCSDSDPLAFSQDRTNISAVLEHDLTAPHFHSALGQKYALVCISLSQSSKWQQGNC